MLPGTTSSPQGQRTTVLSRDDGRAIMIDGLAQRLGGRWALRGVSLSVEAGESIAIVGHNGSGKTTLLRVLATALRPTRGIGQVFGHDLVRESAEVRGTCAMLGHPSGLYGDLTAAENLAFAQRMAGGPPDRGAIRHALERVGMAPFADMRVRTFSSGMQRRTAIARLHLRTARLFLLDEPYNSLDASGVTLVDELLATVRERGGTAVVVLHDLERTHARFDRMLELCQGRVAGGTTRAGIHVA